MCLGEAPLTTGFAARTDWAPYLVRFSFGGSLDPQKAMIGWVTVRRVRFADREASGKASVVSLAERRRNKEGS